MARKLTEEERNSINLLTAAFVAAMPAHLRSHAGSVASSLVRIPRDVITARDINRIVGRIGEHKDELRALIREVALTHVEVAEGEPESFKLVVPADEPEEQAAKAAEEAGGGANGGSDNADGSDGEKDGDHGAGRDSEAPVPGPDGATPDADGRADEGEDAVPDPDPDFAPAAKPSRRSRRRRRVGDKGGLAAQPVSSSESDGDNGHLGEKDEPSVANGAVSGPDASAEVAGSVADPGDSTDAGAAAGQSAAGQQADPASDAAALPAPEKKRRRTRRSKKKPAQASQDVAAEPADAEGQAPHAGSAPVAESGSADVRKEAATPMGEGATNSGHGAPKSAQAPSSEKRSDNDAQVTGVPASDDAPFGNDPSAGAPASAGDSAPLAAEASKDAAANDAPNPSATSDPAPRAAQPARGQRGGRGRRGGQNAKREGQKTLAEVPYIRRGGQAEADLRARIVQLDQRFWMNGWLLSHPGAFQLYEKELLALNEFVVSGTMIGDVTRRQLAYQMGGDEKFFEYGSDGFKLLRSMGVEDLIRHRPLPKADLLFHAPRRRKHMRVLVTENLDPWLDVHDLMYEDGVTQILGERVHAVVLGGGMPVLEQNRLHLLLDTLGAESYEVLYWGDIDRAGLDILIKLQALLEGKFEVKPFVPAYQLMCDRAMARFPDPADNEKTGQVNIEVGDTGVICDGLTPVASDYARAVIEGCSLIPQEILTKRDL